MERIFKCFCFLDFFHVFMYQNNAKQSKLCANQNFIVNQLMPKKTMYCETSSKLVL